tara:strand:- start:24 stop:221 length:198 start_codon:yes stop_codon:yes gene_type:complete
MAKRKNKAKETIRKGMVIDGQGFVPYNGSEEISSVSGEGGYAGGMESGTAKGMGEAIRGGSFKVC